MDQEILAKMNNSDLMGRDDVMGSVLLHSAVSARFPTSPPHNLPPQFCYTSPQSFADGMDISMRSLVHRLLFVFGLMMAAGCVLNDRNLNQRNGLATSPNRGSGNRLSFKQSPRLAQAGQLSNDQSASTSDDEDPKNTEGTTSKVIDSKGWQPGHSIDLDSESESFGKTSSRASAGSSSNKLAASKRTQSNQVSELKSSSTVNDRERRDEQGPLNTVSQTSDNFVQLQGVELEDPASTNQSNRNSRIDVAKMEIGESSDRFRQGSSNEQASGTIPNWSDRKIDSSRETDTKSRSDKSKDSAAKHQGLQKTNTNPSNAAEQLPPLPWQADLENLIARVEEEISQKKSEDATDTQSEYVRRQVQLRILYLMSQQQEEALTAIPGIEPSQQEYWQHMLLAMSNSFDTNKFPDASVRAAQTVTPLSAALREVRDSAPLAIKNMGFCRKISYFGNYERFPRNEFTPGQEVLLYTEIENFVSSPTSDGEYRTSLKSLVEILDSQGKVVWNKPFAPTEDFCRNPRRDYFHNYQFHIPKDLATGKYSMKLTIEDELSHKRNSNSLNFVLK